MKISASTLGCPDWPLATILARYPGYGFDAVDFRGLAGELNVWKLPEFSAAAEATAERIAAAGLAVSCFSSGARMFDPDIGARQGHVAEVAEYARLCRVFGARLIRVFGGRTGGVPVAEAVAPAVEALRRMADAAGDDVTIGVETHDDWVATAPLAEAIARAGRANVGVIWDLHHPYRLAGEAPRETHANIGAMTVGVHVKDSRRVGGGKYEPCLPGRGGDVPLAEMVALLAAGGYAGYLTLEWEKKWHPEIPGPDEALPAYAALMKTLG